MFINTYTKIAGELCSVKQPTFNKAYLVIEFVTVGWIVLIDSAVDLYKNFQKTSIQPGKRTTG
jgi:hypothetical protein